MLGRFRPSHGRTLSILEVSVEFELKIKMTETKTDGNTRFKGEATVIANGKQRKITSSFTVTAADERGGFRASEGAVECSRNLAMRACRIAQEG
jgi:hypothetical protein